MRKTLQTFLIFTLMVFTFVCLAEDAGAKDATAKPWIGLNLKNSVEKKIEEIPNGALIQSVVQGSNAEKIGLKKNDLVKIVNGTEISSVAEFEAQLALQKPQDELVLTVLRKKEEIELKFQLEDSDHRVQSTLEKLGFAVTSFSENDIEGIVVAKVASGSYADYGKLNVNDFILAVDHHDFNSLAEFRALISNVDVTRPVSLMVVRYQDNKQILLPLEVGPEAKEDADESAKSENASLEPGSQH